MGVWGLLRHDLAKRGSKLTARRQTRNAKAWSLRQVLRQELAKLGPVAVKVGDALAAPICIHMYVYLSIYLSNIYTYIYIDI